MTIRPLEPGEERMWIQCGMQEKSEHEIDSRMARFIEQRRQFPENPECFLVAMNGERCRGKLRGMLVHANLYLICSVVTECADADPCCGGTGLTGEDASTASDVARKLITYALERNASRMVEAVNWVRPEDADFDEALRQSGFRISCEKAFVERSLLDFDFTVCIDITRRSFGISQRSDSVNLPGAGRTPDIDGYKDTSGQEAATRHECVIVDPFTYKTLSETGRQIFVDTLAGILAQNVNRDMNLKDPGTELDECIAHAGTAFDAGTWKLALLDGRIAGMVLPQLYHDTPDEGSIFNIGLLPEFRGKGFGRVLHANGLADLKQLGATRYVGSTDILNVPMRRIFAANGCTEKGIRRIYIR